MSSATVGRPRDAGLDERVYRAALALYGRVGWSGFSIEAVAREGRVGKASIYLRWSSKAELLADAVASIMADTCAVHCAPRHRARRVARRRVGNPPARRHLRGVYVNALSAPPHLRERAKADGPGLLEALVSLALAGIGACATSGQARVTTARWPR